MQGQPCHRTNLCSFGFEDTSFCSLGNSCLKASLVSGFLMAGSADGRDGGRVIQCYQSEINDKSLHLWGLSGLLLKGPGLHPPTYSTSTKWEGDQPDLDLGSGYLTCFPIFFKSSQGMEEGSPFDHMLLYQTDLCFFHAKQLLLLARKLSPLGEFIETLGKGWFTVVLSCCPHSLQHPFFCHGVFLESQDEIPILSLIPSETHLTENGMGQGMQAGPGLGVQQGYSG